MSQKYYSVNDLMWKKLNRKSLQLSNDIYEEEETVQQIDDFSFQVLNSDNNLEMLYEELLKYINNQNPIQSIMYKQMIMAHYYEYINCFYDDIDNINQQIYLRMCSDLAIKNIINIFDKYGREIIEMYDYILSIYEHFPEIVTRIRNKIIAENKIRDVFSINPGSILDYRFLFGCKFEEEPLKSIQTSKLLTQIVERINVGNLEEEQIIEEIQILLENEPDIAQFINDNKSYIIANIYSHFKEHNSNDNKINNFINFVESTKEDIVLESINIDNEGLSYFMYIFYLLNRKGLTEQKIKQMNDATKKSNKHNLVKVYNPYYLEEEEYFKHRGN